MSARLARGEVASGMQIRRSTARWPGRLGRWALVAATCGATAIRAAEPTPSASTRSQPPVSATAATSIIVNAGRASFDLPPGQAGEATLVIVSSLARTPGPFPIQVRAEPTTAPARPLAAIPPAPLRPPLQDLAPLPAIPPPIAQLPPAERTFHLMTQDGLPTDPASYRTIAGRLRAVGRRVQVYADATDYANIDAATLRDIVASFDDRVWPAVAGRFGPATDVDGDGRFTILLTSWLSRLGEGKTRVDGFVRGADMDRRQPAPFGNRADMMYLNAQLKAGPHLRTVLAHEYAHAVTFSRKVLDADPRGPLDASAEEEGWLDEAIAHLVEDELGFSRSNLDYRISAFLSQPERYRLVVDDYFAADLFRSHGNRGATYLFLRWCVDRFGPHLLDILVRAPRRGVANLEAATGAPFAELFRRWTVALYASGLDPHLAAALDGYRTLNLRGDLDDWVLAGPRADLLKPGDPPATWTTEGTAAHYLLIAGGSTGTTRVEVAGPAAADLQVTVLPLPPGLARPQLVVRPTTDADGTVRVRARVAEGGGAPVRLGALAWERLVPVADRHTPGFRCGALDRVGIAASFGTATLPAWGALQSRSIPLPDVRPGDGPLVFKAVGVDAHGRRVAAWAQVEPTDRPAALARDINSP